MNSFIRAEASLETLLKKGNNILLFAGNASKSSIKVKVELRLIELGY